MSRVLAALLVAAAASPALAPRPAAAYEPRYTHRWLTRMAAQHLARAYPGEYDELLTHIDRVAEGAEHEDNHVLDGDGDPTTLRVMRHFFRPTDRAGLTMDPHGEFPSSLEWIEGSEHNEWDWQDGIDAYVRGDKGEAYFVLGHVAHLVQDITVPAHTHLDPHPPPSGDDYESYCGSLMMDEHTSLLPTPPEDAPVPAFADLEQAWLATAEASFWRNRYPGDLSDTDQARGVVAEMFPEIDYNGLRERWQIGDPPVGHLGKDFIQEEFGWFYFENIEHAALVDKMDFDAGDPMRGDVFAANEAGTPMVELYARDLVPVAILHGAGLMKLYIDEARARAPDPDTGSMSGGCAATPTPAAPAAPWLTAAALALALALARFRRSR